MEAVAFPVVVTHVLPRNKAAVPTAVVNKIELQVGDHTTTSAGVDRTNPHQDVVVS